MSLLAESEANNVEEPPPPPAAVEDSHVVKSTPDTTPPWIRELIQRRKAKSATATGSTKEATNVGQQWTGGLGKPSGNNAGNIATSTSSSLSVSGGGVVVGKKSTNLTGISSHLNTNNSINKMPVVGLHGASSTAVAAAAINSDATSSISASVGVSVGGHYTTAMKPQQQNEPQIYSELKGSLARIVRNNTTNNNNPSIACDSNDMATLIQQKQVDDGIETVQPTRQYNQTSNLHMAAVVDDDQIVGGGGEKTMATTTPPYSNPINCLSGCSSQLTSICASSRTCFKPIGTVPPLQQHRIVQQKLNADEGNFENVGNFQRFGFITASHSSSCDDDSLVVVDGQPQAQALSKASFVCQLHLRVSCECDNDHRRRVEVNQQSCHGVASSVSNCQIEIELKKKSISCDSIVNSRNFNFKNNTKCFTSGNNNDITTTTTKCNSSSGDNVNDNVDDNCGLTENNSELNSFVNNRINNINNKTAAILPTSASFDSSVIFSKDTNTNSARKMVAAQELTDTFDLDTSEELQYGPGIVSKLRCRYLSLALRQSAAKQRPSLDILRRATSLNNLLDDDDDTTTAHHHHHHHHHHYHQNHKTNGITGYNNQKNSSKLIENNSQQQQNNVNPNYKIRTPDEFVATFKKNLKISEKDKQRSRNMQRGNDSLKRARSVEALIGCDNKSSWDELDTTPQPQPQPQLQQQQTSNNNTNNQNNNINNNSNNNSSSKMLYQMQKSQKSSSVDESISVISNDMVSISSAAEVTVEDKISNARERAANSSCDKVPKRRPPIMDDTERPPPDVVKQTLKIFEAGANRRGRGIQRNSMSGEVAAKVANYKSIIGQERPPILFPKPPLSPKKTQNVRKNSNNISTTTGGSCNNSNSVPAPSSGSAITNLDLVKKTTLNNNNNNNNNTTTATATTTINGNSTNSDANKNQNQNLKKFPISNYPITPAVHTAGKSVQDEDIPQPLKRTIQPKPSPKPEQQQQQSEEVKKLTDIPISKIDSNNFNDIVITTEGNDNFDSSRSALVNVDTSFILTEPERIIPSFGTSTPIPKSQNHKQSITSEDIDIVDDNTVAILDSPSSKTAGSHHYIIHTKPTTLTPREIEKNLINEKKNEESAEFQQISSVMADNGAIPPAPSACDTSQPLQIQTQTQMPMPMQMQMQMPVQVQANPTVDTQPKWQVSKKKSRPTSQAPPNQGNSMVFNFKDRKDIPDYIENDGLLFKRRRELPRPNESGFVLLGDVSLETSTDPDDIWPMGPASPCNIEFENAYILIDGKSSFRDQSKNASSFKVKFDDPLTTTFEYPSENCITDATTDSSTTTAAAHSPNRIDDSNINFNLNINEASNAPDVVIVHGLPQHYGTIPATNATSNNFQNINTSNQTHIDGVVKSPGQKLLGSVSLGSSAPLGSYTPIKAQINTNFELGVTRTQPLSTTISSSSSTSSSGCNNDVTNNSQINGNQNVHDQQNLIMANNRTGLTDNIYNNSIINESDVILNTDNIRNGTTALMVVDNNDDPQEDNLQYLKPATDDLTIVYSQGTKKTDLLY